MADTGEKVLATASALEEKVIAAITDYDVYEIRARVVVGFIIALPTALGFTYLLEGRVTPKFMLSAALVEAVLTLLLAQTVRALGHWRGASKGWDAGKSIIVRALASGPGSPYGYDASQAAQWHAAVLALTGLDIASQPNWKARVRMAERAHVRLLYRFRTRKDVSPFFLKFTIDYGFARNLAGSWPLWMATSLIFTVVLSVYSVAHPAAITGAYFELACFSFGVIALNPLDQQVLDAQRHLSDIFLCAVSDCRPKSAQTTTKVTAQIEAHA